MASADLLIDGYNLLHAAGLGRLRYGPGDLQRARQTLLRRLFVLLTPAEINHAAVVFDARHPPPHLPAHWYIHGLRVVYARPHGDADLLIEELIQQHSHPKRLTVVSSDHRLHQAARTRRAVALDSDEFLAFLEHRCRPTTDLPQPTAVKIKSTGDVAAAELAYWMSVFGDVKVADLADHLRPSPEKKPAPVPRPAKQLDITTKPPRSTARKPASSAVEKNHPDGETQATPELFSPEWIDALQRWANEQE